MVNVLHKALYRGFNELCYIRGAKQANLLGKGSVRLRLADDIHDYYSPGGAYSPLSHCKTDSLSA